MKHPFKSRPNAYKTPSKNTEIRVRTSAENSPKHPAVGKALLPVRKHLLCAPFAHVSERIVKSPSARSANLNSLCKTITSCYTPFVGKEMANVPKPKTKYSTAVIALR